MLISRVSDEAGGEERRAGAESGDHAPEYQTASELFELKTKNTHFDAIDDDSLTTRGLVLLYTNIDIGTKLMNDATSVKHKKSNQYVETIVYDDGPDSESDLSEIQSAEDIHNVFMRNPDRTDFLNDKSLENLLCPKFGRIEMQTTEMSRDSETKFLFKNYCSTNILETSTVLPSPSQFSNIFSTSLIDYICCKRLEDNYNFYMDNIITYVQVTIEQLRRISNGDYLTDRAKEKWREVNCSQHENNTKVLATSTSIPLHVQCKSNKSVTWDDIVQSEVDVRSLSKILEKKIVVEIPKLICGSYRLYSERCDDNLIIRCQREHLQVEKNTQESRVDVVLQLQRSQSGQVMSNISSIMVLRKLPDSPDLGDKEILPMISKKDTDTEISSACWNIADNECYITELSKDADDVIVEERETESKNLEKIAKQQVMEYQESQNESLIVEMDEYPFIDEDQQNVSCESGTNEIMRDSSISLGTSLDMFPINNNDVTFNLISPDELRMTMQKLNKQFSVLYEGEDESTRISSPKRRSPVRARIKSPYENKSYLLEEKKRKRLLEIRERREKKKMALSENCKINKHKYGKGAIMPQASSSVTRLSITNKSFYNSIYGQSLNVENKPRPDRPARKGQKNMVIPPTPEASPVVQIKEEYSESPMLTPEKNKEKYTNRSYYLDDTETEIMYLQMKQNGNKDIQNTYSASNSAISNEYNANLNLLTQLIPPSAVNLDNGLTYLRNDHLPSLGGVTCSEGDSLLVLPIDCEANTVAANPINDTLITKKGASSDECRKSIDQLYDLMKRFNKPNASADPRITKAKANMDTSNRVTSCSATQGSDSDTSIKHHAISSSSCFSDEKNYMEATKSSSNTNHDAVVPKVTISSKLKGLKIEASKLQKDRRGMNLNPAIKGNHENPLKAISQLLHKFDNVQKTRQKPAVEVKPLKKLEVALYDVKTSPRQGSYRRRSRLDQHLKDNDQIRKEDQEKKVTSTNINYKERSVKPVPPAELARMPHLQIPVEDKNLDKLEKKKITDMIDEAKEARGEAVRGPSKLNSRLNSLAQPKRSYVQAHHEEYQNRYGRNMLAERLQRLAGASALEKNTAPSNFKNRAKRTGTESTATALVRRPPRSPHLDKSPKNMKLRRSPNSSAHEQLAWQPLASFRHGSPDAPEALSGEVVEMESYVKSHCGRSTSSSSAAPQVSPDKCRVPLMPHDLDLVSMTSTTNTSGASVPGHMLHRMIDLTLTAAASLTALSELPESSKPGRSEPDSLSPAHSDLDSEDHVDILGDNYFETVAETIDERAAAGDADLEVCSHRVDHTLSSENSTAELEKLENALCNQRSGAFQKRLRIKNLTLTPKHSKQQVFLVQSGDVSSLLLESTVSNLKINKCSAESLHNLKIMPVLSRSHMDWTFTQIPIQIATVGYAFSEYQSRKESSSQVRLLQVSSAANSDNAANDYASDEISQCIQCIQQKRQNDHDAQVDVENEIVTISVGSSDDNETIPQMPVEIDQFEISNQTSNILKTATEVGTTDESDINKAVEEPDASVKDEEIEVSVEPTPEPVYTTSLDMLVGILNEIQKITCQNQMAAANNVQISADFEMILNDTAYHENKNKSRDIISITSIKNLKKLKSNASIYSYYIPNEGDTMESNLEPIEAENITAKFDKSTDSQRPNHEIVTKLVDENIATEVFKPLTVDKEVSANLSENEYVVTFSNVSSSLAPIDVNRSTGVTTITVGAISEPSNQSTLSCADYETLYCNNLFVTSPVNNIVEFNTEIEVNAAQEQQVAQISRDETDLNEIFFKTSSSRVEVKKKEKSLIARSELGKYCAKNIDLDPMLKIKRDILVTVYSILVLTVFAALSFPELIIFQI